MSSLDQDDEVEDQDNEDATTREESPPPSGLRAWTIKASNYVVSKMSILEACKPESIGYLLHPPTPPERAELSLDQNDEEGTTSGGTSGDDIWGTPTSGGPDDESFTASPVRAATKNRRTSKVRAVRLHFPNALRKKCLRTLKKSCTILLTVSETICYEHERQVRV